MARLRDSLIILFVIAMLIAPARSTAQSQGERGLKIRVGAPSNANQNAPAPTLWAVVVGISRYQYGGQDVEGSLISNLKYAAEDAQAFSNFLRSEEGGGFRDQSDGGHLILLKDEQATRANLEQALVKMKQAKPEDYFVLYIASHGVLVPQTDPKTNVTEEIPYFFLYDTDPRSQQSIEQTSLRMEKVQQLVREVPAKKGLILSDTCHSAGLDMAGRGVRLNTSRANARQIEEMRSIPEGIGFIAAARQTQSSLERDALGHGVFTWCLLEGLRGHADSDQDGW
ncbi:MAG: caspase family protein [Blastocatellia bacterium]